MGDVRKLTDEELDEFDAADDAERGAIEDAAFEDSDDEAQRQGLIDDEGKMITPSPLLGTTPTEDSSDFTARVLSQIMAQQPETLQVAPLSNVDELGQELKEFRCRRCQRIDAISPLQYEILNRHGVLCLPCHVPHLFGAKADPDARNGWMLFPKPAGTKPKSRLGEVERRELQARVNELLDLKLRRDFILETMLKLQAELAELEPRVVALTAATIPAATQALERIETDPMLDKKQKAADIQHDLSLLIASMAKKNAKNKIRYDGHGRRIVTK